MLEGGNSPIGPACRRVQPQRLGDVSAPASLACTQGGVTTGGAAHLQFGQRHAAALWGAACF
jgi:hypothetical protein